MSITLVTGLPGFLDCAGTLTIGVRGNSAFVRCHRFIAGFNLLSGKTDWLIERSPPKIDAACPHPPRFFNTYGSGSELWVSQTDEILAEITCTDSGELCVSARHSATGRKLWEHVLPIPTAAEWAEPAPDRKSVV